MKLHPLGAGWRTPRRAVATSLAGISSPAHGRKPVSLGLRRAVLVAGLAGTLVLTGCSALVAQNPSGALRPVNAVADGAEERLMLKGADVVAYFTQGRYVPGVPAHRSVHEGVACRFASAEHKALFDAAPQKYLPQYGGYCANGIVYGIPWGGDADAFRMIDGKLTLFIEEIQSDWHQKGKVEG
jgi:YHS domain-containing protein